MRVGVNLLPLRPGGVGGAEVYVRALLGELMRRRPADHYLLVTAGDNHDTLRFPHPNHTRRLALRRLPPSFERLGGRLTSFAPLAGPARLVAGLVTGHFPHALRRIIRAERLDLWFCPFTNLDPRPLAIPGVITVYDLQHEAYPENFAPQELAARRSFYAASCRGAARVLAISEHTRRDVVARYGIEPERVVTTPLFPGPEFGDAVPRGRVEEVRARYGLPPRYLLYPAHTWRHKNHAFLIDIVRRVRERMGVEGPGLVLTGRSFEGEAELEARVERLGLSALVWRLPRVPSSDLPPLFAGAAGLVFPSLFEGFGIPLVEAMRVGCPVVAARATSIPEVVGNAGLLFDPRDPEDGARAVIRLLGEPGLAAELVRRGRERARLFTLERNVEGTLGAFAAAARNAGGAVPEAPPDRPRA